MINNDRQLDTLNHEIRTPLTGLLGMIHQLNAGPLTAHQKDCIQNIDIASQALLDAVEHFLQYGEMMTYQAKGE